MGIDLIELKELYERFAPVVHRRARSLLKREDDSWDAVHDVFRLLLGHRRAFRREARPMTYIYQVTTNVCLNRLRRSARATSVERADPETSGDRGDQIEARQLLSALAVRVPRRALEVAALHYIDELPQEEIARVLGVARKTVQRDLAALQMAAEALGSAPAAGADR